MKAFKKTRIEIILKCLYANTNMLTYKFLNNDNYLGM